MAETTIQWSDFTMNPWIGCVEVSPACDNCYARTYDKRVGGVPVGQRVDPKVPILRWGPKAPRTRTKGPWLEVLKWHAAAEKLKKRARVFCASLADFFEDNARFPLDTWRLEVFDLIARTPWLDWQLLTKRPHAIQRQLSAAIDMFPRTPGCAEGEALLQRWVDGTPPANVWLGTTVEDQKRANERIPELLKVPARVRFLSCEPLLEHVDLTNIRWGNGDFCNALRRDSYRGGLDSECIDWIIIGGESGGNARPFNVAWARSLIEQARSGLAAPFVKQLGANIRTRNDDGLISDFSEGGWFLNGDWQIEDHVNGYREDHQGAEVRIRLKDSAGGDVAEWPEDLRVREFPQPRTQS